ncbi:hypothetical protein DSCW_28060 [Desulfosarcina widdelii]|uniref:histidine kinase n=1 Tax=Desulfosarcina widdelii TaxID=947919 RepID=A0A5K7Z589_9BACT|nr:PAS domain S-box protein [Desulfosarcina widdelii]BBO75389.1 hypothetical protein DSCW_28060 [Desulfosarcina widdelii]
MKSPIPLKGYLSLLFGIVAILPIITIAVLVWFFVMPSIQSRTGNQHRALARSIAGQISTYLEGGERQLTALAEYLQDRQVQPDTGPVRLLDAQCGKGEFFETLFVVDNTEAVIQSVGLPKSRRASREDYIGLDLSGRKFADTAKDPAGGIWSQTFLSTVSSRMAVALTIPLADGFIIGEITLDRLSAFISQLPVESEYHTMVIDARGQIVADSRNLRWGEVVRADFPLVRGLAGATSTATRTFELDGERMLGTMVEMDVAGWKVLVVQPIRLAFQPIRDTFTLIALGIAVALGLVLSISWLLAGKFSTLFTSYARKAEFIAKGRYDLQWPKAKTWEFARLGQSLERMAEMIKQREKALVDGEQRLKELLANVPGVVYQFEAAPDNPGSYISKIVLLSKAFEMFGLDSGPETYFDDFVACLPPEDQPRFIASVKEAVEEFKPWYYQGRFIKPSGEALWIEGNSTPRRVVDKIVFYGLLTDITHRKEMESSLHLTQFCYDSASIGIYQIESGGRILNVNAHAAQMLGYTIEELSGLSVADIDPDTDHELMESGWRRLVSQGTDFFETTHRCKDGSRIPVQITTTLLEYDDRQFSICFVQDITERKRIEKSLQITQFSFDNANVGIHRVLRDGRIREVNRQFAQMLGYTKEELETMSIVDIDTAFADKTWDSIWEELVARGLIAHESTHRRKDGRRIPVEIYANLLEFEGQQYAIAFAQDITERRSMEQALKESEERLDLALSGANEGIWDWHIDQDAVYFDSRYYTMAGYGPYAFPGAFDEFEKRVRVEDRERVKSAITRYLSGGLDDYKVEFRFRRKDGNYMWVQSKGKIVAWDDQGKPARFIGTHADITERMQAEEALQISEARLKEAQELAGLGYWEWNVNTGKVDWSKKVYEILHLDPSEYSPRIDSIMALSPWPEYKKRHEEIVQRFLQTKEKGSFDQKFLRPDGSIGYYYSTFGGKFDGEGNLTTMQGTIVDITQRKKIEEELRQLRNYLTNIIDSMPSVLVGVDMEGRVTQWNKQAEKVTGRPSSQVLAKPLNVVFSQLADQLETIKTAIKERRVINSPKIAIKAGQETRFEDITIFPLVTNGVEGAVIRVDDVTERVRLEEMMIQSEKMLSVGGLAAGMAHEINNPLAGILQNASVLSNRLTGDLPANHEAAEAAGTSMTAIRKYLELRKLPNMIENIRKSGSLAAIIVKNMLSFARKSDSTVSSHDLSGLLDQSLDLLKTDYDMKKHYDFKKIAIVREYDDATVPVPCESSKIQQVFINILKNGAEAMAEVSSPSTQPMFLLRVRNDGDWVRVEIEDNGPGMDETTRRRIFEPFFTTKPVGKGTGLGLSVSYFIITEDHGGEMRVHAVEDCGTRFVLRLPKEGKGDS